MRRYRQLALRIGLEFYPNVGHALLLAKFQPAIGLRILLLEEGYPRTLWSLSGASARSRVAGSKSSIPADRTDSVLLDVKQARVGCCSLLVCSAPGQQPGFDDHGAPCFRIRERHDCVVWQNCFLVRAAIALHDHDFSPRFCVFRLFTAPSENASWRYLCRLLA